MQKALSYSEDDGKLRAVAAYGRQIIGVNWNQIAAAADVA